MFFRLNLKKRKYLKLKKEHFLFNTPLELIYKGQNKKNTIFTDQTFMNLSCILAALHI